MRRWTICAGGILLAGVAALFLLVPAELLVDAPRRAAERRMGRVMRRLAEKQKVLALFTFDDAAPRDWISGAHGIAPGTVVVPARFGGGRKFDGRDRTWIDWPIEWRGLGSQYSIATWVKVDARSREQGILCAAGGGLRTGFRLENGALRFDVPGEVRQCVSYPFERYGEFVHLAATVDSADGIVTLYENGSPMATGAVHAVRWPTVNLAAGKAVWHSVRHPFRGVMDDTVFWKRTLTPAEIRRLSHSRQGVLPTLSPKGLYVRWRYTEGWAVFLRGVMTVRDLANPRFFSTPHGSGSSLPTLGLVLTGSDRRQLIGGHERSRRSGRRIWSATRPRRIHVCFQGSVHRAEIRLDGSDTRYADAVRPGYVLELDDGIRIAGSSRILLQPPESSGFLKPFVFSRLCRRFGVPAVADGLCRLTLNGVFLGIYRYSDHARNGVLPGDFPEAESQTVQSPADWRSMTRGARLWTLDERLAGRRWPCSLADVGTVYDAVSAEIESILLSDPQSPWSTRELRLRLQKDRLRMKSDFRCAPPEWPSARRAAEFLDEFQLLGGNRSPFHVVESLDLATLRIPGATLAWESSRPAVLRSDGSVSRPSAGGPVDVTLRALIRDGTEECVKDLSFRVMPETRGLPAIFLDLNEAVTKARRVDAVVEIFDAGESNSSRCLLASQSTRGGVNHRGNSSYWSRKKLLTIRTDAPHGLFGEDGRRVLKTVNGRQDPTFVRNGLAYGLFREFGEEPGAPRIAPFVRPAELFVNGRYHGLFELCTGIDEALLGEAEWDGKGQPPVIVYRHETLPPRDSLMRASRPSRRKGTWMEPYRALEAMFAETDWRVRIERTLDVDSVVDLQLLLNFMQNRNGSPFHFLAHDVLVYRSLGGGTFFHVPWDFDRCLGPNWSWIANEMMRQLESVDPGYRERLARRWFALRREVLAESAVLQRVDSLVLPVADYVKWERFKWGYGETESYEEQISRLKDAVRRNLDAMDHALAAWQRPCAATRSDSCGERHR